MNLSHEPIQVQIDQIDVELAEPEVLKPNSTFLADKKARKLKKRGITPEQAAAEEAEADEKARKKKQKSSRGLLGRIIDGVSLSIRRLNVVVRTLGPFKREGVNVFTPPTIRLEIDNFSTSATNGKWEVRLESDFA